MVAARAVGEKAGTPNPPEDKEQVIASMSAVTAHGEAKRSGPSGTGQPLSLGDAQEGEGDRSPTPATGRSSVGISLQPQPHPSGQEGARGSIGSTSEVDAGAGEKEAGPDPSGTPKARGKGISETEGLAPRLKLSLPWNDDGGPGLERFQGPEGEAGKSPIAAGASGGGMSARTVGAGGSAAAGLTYPGPRPLSVSPMRSSFGAASPMNATSPILSGRRFEGTSVGMDGDLGGSRSLGRTAGASLAGRLMSYATRPGGTFDVFAAARDGQVGRARTPSISVGICGKNGGDSTKSHADRAGHVHIGGPKKDAQTSIFSSSLHGILFRYLFHLTTC